MRSAGKAERIREAGGEAAVGDLGSAVTLDVEEVLDRPPRSFEQFVRENVKAFGG